MADSASSIVANAAPPARPTTAADSSRFARRSEAAAADLRTLRHVDSIATAMQKAAASASMSASAPRNDFAGRAAFQRALVGTAPAIDSRAVGCYRVDGDSSRAVPSPLHRFSLTKPDSTGGSTVRLIDTGGRRDSTLAGAGWHSLPGDSVLVVAPNGPQRITLIFGVVGEGQRSGGRLAADGRSVSIGVLRTKCP
jgi:hypothetical protein